MFWYLDAHFFVLLYLFDYALKYLILLLLSLQDKNYKTMGLGLPRHTSLRQQRLLIAIIILWLYANDLILI